MGASSQSRSSPRRIRRRSEMRVLLVIGLAFAASAQAAPGRARSERRASGCPCFRKPLWSHAFARRQRKCPCAGATTARRANGHCRRIRSSRHYRVAGPSVDGPQCRRLRADSRRRHPRTRPSRPAGCRTGRASRRSTCVRPVSFRTACACQSAGKPGRTAKRSRPCTEARATPSRT